MGCSEGGSRIVNRRKGESYRGGLVDVDALIEELMTNMSKSDKTAYEPKEVVELVVAAVEGVFARDRREGQFPIGASPPEGQKP